MCLAIKIWQTRQSVRGFKLLTMGLKYMQKLEFQCFVQNWKQNKIHDHTCQYFDFYRQAQLDLTADSL